MYLSKHTRAINNNLATVSLTNRKHIYCLTCTYASVSLMKAVNCKRSVLSGTLLDTEINYCIYEYINVIGLNIIGLIFIK